MRTAFLTSIFILFSSLILAQDQETDGPDGSIVGTAGFMQGGRSIVGLDIEFFVTDKFGAQVGLGLFSVGAALNYHFKRSISGTHLSFFFNYPTARLTLDSRYRPTLVSGRELTGVSVVHRFRGLLSLELGAAVWSRPSQVLNQQGFIISPVIAVGVYKYVSR